MLVCVCTLYIVYIAHFVYFGGIFTLRGKHKQQNTWNISVFLILK